MAGNAYGDGNKPDLCKSNEERNEGKNSTQTGLQQLSQLLSDQSKEFFKVVEKFLKEKDAIIKEKDEEIQKLKVPDKSKELEVVENLRKEKDAILREKDEEIRNLKDELELMKQKVDELSEGRAGAASEVSSGTQERPKTPRFQGMERRDSLYTFIDKKIRPDGNFKKKCNQIIDTLVRKIQAKESPFNVKRIVKSGSLGKGTHVKNKSDIDLIIFLNDYKTVQELQKRKPEILDKLKNFIQEDWSDHLRYKKKTPNAVQFSLKIDDRDDEVDVDLLPALDITRDGRTLSEIYDEMKALSQKEWAPYATCFSPLQLEFVSATNRVSTPGKVKDLIRLLKNWAKDEEVSVGSYCLELLVVDLWRKGGKPPNIDTEKYLQDVLEILANCENLELAFEDNYQYRDYRPDLKKPFLLDPANPFCNVAPVLARDIKNIKQKVEILRNRTAE